MTEKFEVGEVAIYVRHESKRYGEEVTVVGCLMRRSGIDTHTGKLLEADGYAAESRDGVKFNVLPEWLRKKKPPQRELDRKVSWEDCYWKPAKRTVEA